MNEQYITLVGKVCAPRYEEVYTPEVKSKLPIEATSEGRKLKDWGLYGNNNPNRIDETQNTLPYAMTAYGGNATDWEIYGNNNPVIETESNTLPIDISSSGGTAADWVISGNNNVGKNLLPSAVNGTYTSGRGTVICNNGVYTFKISAGTGAVSITVPIPEFTIPVSVGQGGNGVLYFLNDKATSEIAIPFMYNGSSVMSNYTPLTVNRVINDYGTTETKQCNGIQFFAANSVGDYEITISPMFITDGIAPDHYIPYQQGVGENTEIIGELPIDFRSNGDDLLGYKIYGTADGAGVQTENLFNINESALVQIDAQGTMRFGVSVGSALAGTYTLSFTNAGAYMMYVTTRKGATYSQSDAITVSPYTITLANNVDELIIRTTSSVMTTWESSGFTKIMLTEGSTAPDHYIPYGYKLLLIVTSGTESKDTDIYIGDSKLLSGDYVDYESSKIYKAKRIHEDTVTIDGIVWDILGYDHDEVYKADGTRAKHTVTIQTHDVINNLQYYARQAAFAFPNGLAAGTYHFTVGAHPWVAGDVGKALTFTLANAIPSGGQLVFSAAYNQTLVGSTISLFASPTSTTAAETVTMTEGSTGTDLGTMLRSKTDTINCIERALFGSNNWLESAFRQYLNSDKVAGNVWTPQTAFDRPPIWATDTAGFLNDKSANFISHIGTAKKTTGRNTVIDGDGAAVHDEKVFPLSRTEAYAGNEYAGGEDTPYAYYKDYSDSQNPSADADSNRIKYYAGVAKNWSLRSPVAGSSYGVRLVSTSGAFSGGNATSVNGVAPACCIVLDDMDDWVKQTFYTEVDADLPAIETFKSTNTLDSTIEVGETMITQGYRIPLQIKQGATTKTADIYIGSSPLRQGQTITKSQSNVDLELFSGDNIIDTSLYNKPNTSIIYNSSVLGVGERTTNLFDEDDIELIQVGTNMYRSATSMGKLAAGTYILSYIRHNDLYVTLRTGTSFYDHIAIPPYTFTVSDTVDEVIVRSTKQVVTPWSELGIYDIVLRRDGYQIPISVTSGQQSTPHTIYIGDSPLTEGQSISKTSTGTEIALYQGENTISTTLGNKPEMKIDYLSTEVGVGERTENLFDGNFEQGLYRTTDGKPINSSHYVRSDKQVVSSGETYTFSFNCPKVSTAGSGKDVWVSFWTADNDYIGYHQERQYIDHTTFITPENAGYVALFVGAGVNGVMVPTDVSDVMLVKSSAAPTSYSPYGYIIPIDIKQGDEVVDHKDIYIGTQPLVEGASISKASVGEDITLVSGKNYIDAVSFNKPEMYIK